MKNVAIIGAGNVGSRHLQALKAVDFPLSIMVIDPDLNSLAIAKERYNSIPLGIYQHQIEYFQKIEDINVAIGRQELRR